MVVISISATPSERQLVQGIPQYVSLVANIPCIIFYTLDNTEPTISSSVYADVIEFPRDKSLVTLKAFATNGSDSSAIFSVTYKTNIGGVRKAYADVTFLEQTSTYTDLVGGTRSSIKVSYNNTSPALGVDLAGQEPVWADGYDYLGNGGVQRSDIMPVFDDTRLTDTGWQGIRGPGIGELVQNDVVYLPPDPQEASMTSKRFNPRAMVLFADSRVETDIPTIFRPTYWDADFERNRPSGYGESYKSDGNKLLTGSFIRQFYNHRDNTMTYYYRDSLTNRWIISVESMQRPETNNQNTHLLNVYTSGDQGAGYVFRWVLFRGTSVI